MKKRVSYLIILFIALISVMQSMAQSNQPDVIGMGTKKKYYVNATPGSSYIWKINEESLEESTTNSVNINWTTPGNYSLTVQEITKDNCVGQVQSLHVTVVALPTATISGTTITCQNSASPVVTFTGSGGIAPYTFTFNINDGTSKTVTTTTGDTVTVSVPTSISGIFAYNLLDVTDSRGFTNTQTGTATINISSPSHSETKLVICPLQLPFKWNQLICTREGTYSSHFLNSEGCDSVATLNLVVQSPIVTSNEITICASELPYKWNGLTLTKGGTYSSNFITPAGCDSVTTLVLNTNPPTGSMKTASICQGDSYEIDGQKFTQAGSYKVKLQSSSGCDSIVTLVLDINPVTEVSQVVRLFNGETFTVNGHTYDQPGVYSEVIKRKNSCDSVVVTQLSYINVPNTFTPNADGLNDYFMKGYHVQIYNRNGILLFEGLDGWDGKYKNNPVSNDTYFYVLYINSVTTPMKTKEGYITVVH